MGIQLAQNERLIKSWDYSKSKQRRDKSVANLSVTDKRIITSLISKNTTEVSEIPLNSVKAINCTRDKRPNIWAILEILLGIATLIVIVGILLIVDGVKRLNQGNFVLEIITYGDEGSSLLLGATKKKSSRRNKGKLKVTLNHKAIDEIASSIGAIILENKASA